MTTNSTSAPVPDGGHAQTVADRRDGASGYVIVDDFGNELTAPVRFTETEDSIVFESGEQFIERSMKTGPTVCFSSAAFRKKALLSGGGLRSEDGVIDDLPMLLRIAADWDFAYVTARSRYAAHSEASSSSLGSFMPDGFRSSRGPRFSTSTGASSWPRPISRRPTPGV